MKSNVFEYQADAAFLCLATNVLIRVAGLLCIGMGLWEAVPGGCLQWLVMGSYCMGVSVMYSKRFEYYVKLLNKQEAEKISSSHIDITFAAEDQKS